MPILDSGGICAVCLKAFPRIVGHHVYPQAYGGRNGPIALLCTEHHDRIHATATSYMASLRSGSAPPEPWGTPAEWRRALTYVQVIVQLANNGSESSRLYRVTLELTSDERSALGELKVRLGVSSLEKAVRRSLNLTYRRLTGKNKFYVDQ